MRAARVGLPRQSWIKATPSQSAQATIISSATCTTGRSACLRSGLRKKPRLRSEPSCYLHCKPRRRYDLCSLQELINCPSAAQHQALPLPLVNRNPLRLRAIDQDCNELTGLNLWPTRPSEWLKKIICYHVRQPKMFCYSHTFCFGAKKRHPV